MCATTSHGGRGYRGIIGTINCDNFGDFGAAKTTVVQNIVVEQNVEASLNNVIFLLRAIGPIRVLAMYNLPVTVRLPETRGVRGVRSR